MICMLSRQMFARIKALIQTAVILSVLILLAASPALAQSISADGTLGTTVTVNGANYFISDGTLRGANQFHSFGAFNVLEGESATFRGPAGITNIIGRVTGGSESLINGLVASEISGANLYLLNPYGVLFGPNASLNLSGSFHVSTADYLRLGESGVFYASPSESTVLTIDPPSAFGFLNDNPAGIGIQQSLLEVPGGKHFSAVGGDITIDDANILAPGGRIDIACVASAGEVVPNPKGEAAALDTTNPAPLGAISVSNSLINAGGAGGGTVIIRGGRFLATNSNIYASA